MFNSLDQVTIASLENELQDCSFWNGNILSRISMLVSLPGLNAVGILEGCGSVLGLSSLSRLPGGESLHAGELGREDFACSTRGLAVTD